jgi:hypothetical protein
MTAQELHREATKSGLRLEPAGDKLAVIPASRCPPEVAEVLRKHKGELLVMLSWIHVARQVTGGEFEGADRSTAQILTTGLSSLAHLAVIR